MANEDDRNLPARADESRRSVKLHDNGLRAGNLIDHAISRLDENQVKALVVEAMKKALELQAREARQNMDYVAGKRVAEDHIDTWNALNKDGKTTRQSLTTDIETGAGRMRIESKTGATCFVATAAYGDWRHPEVEYLRWYRDNILVTSAAGRTFIRVYWQVGPHLAKLVAPYPRVQTLTRGLISPLVRALRALHPSP
jgi:hypothetical protein